VIGGDSQAAPPGWALTTLSAIADLAGGITKGQRRKPADRLRSVPYLRVANVQRGFLDLEDVREIEATEAEIEELRLLPGDVLFNEGGDRDKLGRGWVWGGEFPECIHQNHVFRARLRSPDIVPKLISWYGNSLGQQYFIAQGKQTTNLASLNLTNLGQLPVLLPPASEQRRLVTEIEKHFSCLDAAEAALKRAQVNLKRYRAAVLKAACEGRLVRTEAELARAEGRAYEQVTFPGDVPTGRALPLSRKRAGRLWGGGSVPSLTEEERSKLPEGWSWAKVRNLGDLPEETVQVGPMSMRSQDFSVDGVPVLNVGCIRWGSIDESKRNALPPERASKFERYRVEAGDVLFTRSGSVGRCAVAQDRHRGWLITFHLLRVRPSSRKCLPEFLRIVFEGAEHIRRQTREASIGSTRAGFNTNLLAGLDVGVPPPAEQRRIVFDVERRLSVLDDMEAAVAANLRRAERLRQAVLKRAFAGKLVPQDPNDEPAAVLLERLRAERTASATGLDAKVGPRRRNGQTRARGRVTSSGTAPDRAAGGPVQPALPGLA
jgi:type I restriction enzyme S subunit